MKSFLPIFEENEFETATARPCSKQKQPSYWEFGCDPNIVNLDFIFPTWLLVMFTVDCNQIKLSQRANSW